MGELATVWEMPSANLAPIYTALVVFSILWMLKMKALFLGGAHKNLPPSPPGGLPVIGHLHLLRAPKPLHQILAHMAQQFGPLISLRLGSVQTLVVTSPKLAEECLKDNDKIFSGRLHLTVITHLTYDGQDVAMARRTTPEWRHLKKVSVVELHSHKRLEATRRIRETEVASMLLSVLHESKNHSSTAKIALREKLFRMNFNIISIMALKKRYLVAESDRVEEHEQPHINSVEQGTDFKGTIEECFVVAGMICLQDCFPILKYFKEEDCLRRMKEVRCKLDKFFQTILDEHKEKKAALKVALSDSDRDMVDVLLDNGELTDVQIKATLLNMYLGATESVILPMEWAMTEAIRNPRVMERAKSELDEEIGRNRMCTEADMPRLNYIRAIVTETLRLHPGVPLMMPRETTSECRIAGYDVPANTRVLVNLYAIGRDPQNWENPLEFNPDRFLEGASVGDEDVRAGQDFRMLAFGARRRMCPGINLGLAIVQLAVANLIHGFEWSASEDALDVTEGAALSNPKLVPLRAIARARLPEDVYSSVQA